MVCIWVWRLGSKGTCGSVIGSVWLWVRRCGGCGVWETSQDAKVDLKALIVAVMPIYFLSETINLFFFLFLCVFNKLIIFSVS